jgi:hypothetical protein
MKIRTAPLLLAAALAALPTLSRADDVRWESLHVYSLASGGAVAVAVPAEWRELTDARVLRSPLVFADGAGRQVAIPVATLARAAAERRVYRPDLSEKIALGERK